MIKTRLGWVVQNNLALKVALGSYVLSNEGNLTENTLLLYVSVTFSATVDQTTLALIIWFGYLYQRESVNELTF